MKVNIQKALTELHRGFDCLNEAIFDNGLPEPVILIQTHGTRIDTLGWCTLHPVWCNKTKTIEKYEITICAEYLSRPVIATMGTMLHEMVHLHNIVHNIKDVSRGGTYHNKNFKEMAELHGLIVERGRYGYCITSLDTETEELIKGFNLDQEAFILSRLIPGEKEKKIVKKTVKMSCRCDIVITCDQEINATCGVCGQCFKTQKKESD